MQESAVLDVPDISIFEYSTAEALIEQFHDTWGIRPQTVALPVVCPQGVPFDNDFTPPASVRYGGRNEVYLGDIAYEFAAKGMDTLLVLTPTLPFVRSDVLHIIDVKGASSAHVCIAKSSTQKYLRLLLEAALQRVKLAYEKAKGKAGSGSLAGVVVDLCNIWPMGAKNERIVLTCFCQECRDQIARLSSKGRALVPHFERFPNAWNLLLKDSGSGVEFIDDIRWDTPPKRILELSHLKGFDELLRGEPDYDMNEEADYLAEYMRARHLVTVGALKNLMDPSILSKFGTEARPLRRVLTVESSPYDWTSGAFFAKLDDPEVCDEIWVDPSAEALTTKNVDMRSYMWRRNRYFIDAFFELWANCQNEEKRTTTELAQRSDEQLKTLLELRRRQVMAASLRSKLDLFLLPPLATDGTRGRIGFIGVEFSDELSKNLVSGVRLSSGERPVSKKTVANQ